MQKNTECGARGGVRGRSAEFAREQQTKQHHGRFVPEGPLRPSRAATTENSSHIILVRTSFHFSTLSYLPFLSSLHIFFFMLVCKEEEEF